MVDPRGNLFAINLPTCADIPGPGGGAVALLSCERGSGQNVDPLAIRLFAKMVIQPAGDHQRVGVEIPRPGAQVVVLHPLHCVLGRFFAEGIDDVRLGGVQPPAINALGIEPLLQILPIEVVGLGIEGIIELEPCPARGLEQKTVLVHFFVELAIGPQPSPDGNREMEVETVERLHHLGRLGIADAIPDHPAPVAHGAPVVPVLDNVVDRDPALAVFLRHRHHLVLGVVVLLALPVSVGPLSVHGRGTSESAVTRNGAIDVVALYHVVVEVVTNVGGDGQPIGPVLEDGLGSVVPQKPVALGRNQEGRTGLRVGLHQGHRAAPVVHVSILMLSKPVDAFCVGEPKAL